MPQGIVVLSNDKIDFFNPQAEKILDLPSDVLSKGKSSAAFFEHQLKRGDFGDNGPKYLQKIMSSIENRIPNQIERTVSSGKILKIDGIPRGDDSWVITYTDISEIVELLAATELDSKQKMFTDVIVKSGASLLTIINDILDFSKIDAGQMELDPAPFALAEAIEDVATLVSSKVALHASLDRSKYTRRFSCPGYYAVWYHTVFRQRKRYP